MRLIDADALKEGIKELKQSPWYNNDINTSWKQGIKDAVHVVETLCIDEEPTVDAVPVVRCKDCKYRDEQSANCTRFRKDWYVQSNSFCSWAERKEE